MTENRNLLIRRKSKPIKYLKVNFAKVNSLNIYFSSLMILNSWHIDDGREGFLPLLKISFSIYGVKLKVLSEIVLDVFSKKFKDTKLVKS